jgi:LysM repeat protein
MDQRTRRTPARFLAPLALIAVVVAFLMIVNGSGTSGSGSSASPGTVGTTTKTAGSTGSKTSTGASKARTKSLGPKAYIVQAGDTLGGIAAKTGVPLARIQELNPAVDPHAMTTGQKIKLR